MLPQIRSELLKLTTIRTSLYFVLVTVLFVAGIVVIQAVTAGGEFSGPLGDPATQQSLFTTAAAAPLIAICSGVWRSPLSFATRRSFPPCCSKLAGSRWSSRSRPRPWLPVRLWGRWRSSSVAA